MSFLLDSPFTPLFAWMITDATARYYYGRRSKRDPTFTEFDKETSIFRVETIATGFALIVVSNSMRLTSTFGSIDKNDTAENILRSLIEHHDKVQADLVLVQDAFFAGMFLVAIYLAFAVDFARKMQKLTRTDKDPTTQASKKPLGR